MECEKSKTVGRLAVYDPEALSQGEWRQHLEKCPVCRSLYRGMEQSLALFSQLERRSRDKIAEGPSWEAMAQLLEQEKHQPRRWLLGMPLAAAMGVMLVTGLAMWNYQYNLTDGQGNLAENAPGKQPVGLVKVEPLSPQERERLNRESPFLPAVPVERVGFGTERVMNVPPIQVGPAHPSHVENQPFIEFQTEVIRQSLEKRR